MTDKLPGRASIHSHFLRVCRFSCVFLIAVSEAHSSVSRSETLWEEVRAYQQAGDEDAALRVLAELSTHEAHAVSALQEAALIYLRRGEREQARSILGMLRELPAFSGDPQFLIQVNTILGDAPSIRDIVEANPGHNWDRRSALLIARAYRDLGIEAPEFTHWPDGERTALGVSVETSFLAYQTHPFRDESGVSDTEYSSRISVRFEQGLSRTVTGLGAVALMDERSEHDPEGFSRYRVGRLRLQIGAKWSATSDAASASLLLGGTMSRAEVYPGDRRPELDPQPELKFEFSRSLAKWALGLRHVESSFLLPSFTDVGVERYRRSTLELGRGLTRSIHAEAYGSYVTFSEDTEDYEEVGGRVRFTPSGLRQTAFFVDFEHEFRDEPEFMVGAGVDWGTVLGGGLLLFVLPRFEANLDTGERELDLQVFTKSGETRTGVWSIGLGATLDVSGDRDRSGYLMLRWAP